jgi:para-nitrobenzyl esterase
MGSDPLLVETRSGKVRGIVRDGARVWRGIPYAAPPVGPLRFRPPGPAPTWTGERDASKYGAVAEQSRDPRVAVMSGMNDKIAMSEDCLALNVFAPAEPSPTPRPVMVWIHGGAFVMGMGSSPLYNGAAFATGHDLIVVTITYRLGLFGFLYLGDLGGAPEGNQAILDQIAALAWVRDNIAGFGGDPGAVTVMGESAGAVSIGTLLAMPAARGLFQRAILQSGASGLKVPDRDDATAVARAVLAELGTTRDGLADVPVDRIMKVQDRLGRERGLSAFMPFVDGVTVPRPPIELIRDGAAAGVPILLGSNRDEFTLFAMFLGDGVLEAVKSPVRKRLGDDELARVLALYRDARADHDERRAWIDLVGDVAFRVPMIRLAEAQAGRGEAVWMYRFDWTSTAFEGRLGAAHAIELPFVWSKLDLSFSAVLLGADLAGARALGQQMHDTWATFVRTGAPDGGGLPPWPRYDEPRRATMLLDRTCAVVDDPGAATRAVWPRDWR